MSVLNLTDFKTYRDKGFLVVDTRDPQDFAAGFVPGSLNLSFDGSFEEPIFTLVMKDRAIILVAEDGPAEINALKEAGFTNIAGYLSGGFQNWLDAGEQIDMIISISPYELALDFKHDENLTLYDLRPELAFQQEHLKNSYNRTVDGLLNELPDLHTNKTYYLLCWDGRISMAVISLLKERGYHNFYHIAGGFQAAREEEKVELIKPAKQK